MESGRGQGARTWTVKTTELYPQGPLFPGLQVSCLCGQALATERLRMPPSPLLNHATLDKLLIPSETHLQPQNGIKRVLPHHIHLYQI